MLADLSIIYYLSFVSHSQTPHWGYALLWILLLLWEVSFSVFANPSCRLLPVPWICHKQVLKCRGGLLCFIRRQEKNNRQLFHVGKLFSEVNVQLSFLTYFVAGVHRPWKERGRKEQCKQANRIICNDNMIKVTVWQNSRLQFWHGRGAPDHVQMEVSCFQGAWPCATWCENFGLQSLCKLLLQKQTALSGGLGHLFKAFSSPSELIRKM